MSSNEELTIHEKVCRHCGQYRKDNNMKEYCNHDHFPARCTYCYFRLKRGEKLYL